MEDTNLVAFSFKEGWLNIPDFIMAKMDELNDEDLSYQDCLLACGYNLDPAYDFSRSEECPYFLRVFMTLEQGYPAYLVQMSISPEMATENFVCADGLSLVELLAKLAPIVQLKLTCTKPTQALHIIDNSGNNGQPAPIALLADGPAPEPEQAPVPAKKRTPAKKTAAKSK